MHERIGFEFFGCQRIRPPVPHCGTYVSPRFNEHSLLRAHTVVFLSLYFFIRFFFIKFPPSLRLLNHPTSMKDLFSITEALR